jgi:serine protease Do
MKRGFLFALLSAALVLIIALAVVGAAFLQPRLFRDLIFAPQLTARLNRSAEGLSTAEIIARANSGVVTVIALRTERPRPPLLESDSVAPDALKPDRAPDLRAQRGYGTGFIIDPEGYIVTNDHVIKDADRIKIKLADGRERKAAVQGTDPATDLALLKIEADQLEVLSWGDSDAVRVGDPVIAIGNPLDYEHSVTSGIISATGRKVYHDPPYEDFLQTDAAINRGNSGGPLLNRAGEVIGVNTVIRMDGHGIGFAIPSKVVKRVVAQLRTQGYVARGFLGLTPQNLTPEFRDGLGLGDLRGVLVAEVKSKTAAARAGIEPYDVITRLDGQAISSADEFFTLVSNMQPQREIELEVVRHGQTLRLRATLERRDEQGRARPTELPPLPSGPARLGFAVRDNTAEAQRALRVSGVSGEVVGGVIITEVDPLSLAADAGLSAGQIILEANRQQIRNLPDFQQATDRLRDGDALVLRLYLPHRKDTALVALRVGEGK